MSVRAPIQGIEPTVNLNPKIIETFVGDRHFAAQGVTTATANRVTLSLIRTEHSSLLVRTVSGEISTAGGAGKNIRMAIYADMGFTPVGGAMLYESGNILADVAGVKEWTLNQRLGRGYYWVGMQFEDATMQFRRYSQNTYFVDKAGEFVKGCFFENGAFGAFTNPCPAVTAINTVPIMAFEIASL